MKRKFKLFILSIIINIQNEILAHGKDFATFAGERCEVVKYTILENENRLHYGKVLRFEGNTVTVYAT